MKRILKQSVPRRAKPTRREPGFDVREQPNGTFRILFDNCPVGEVIHCPFEASAYLRQFRAEGSHVPGL